MNEIKLQDFLEKIPSDFRGIVLAELSDCILLETWEKAKPVLVKEEIKILDVRVFNDRAEYRLFRGNIGEDFQIRVIDASKEGQGDYNDFYDECQFLDIDAKESLGNNGSLMQQGVITATGGGTYRLPEMNCDYNNLKIKIRYYFKQYKKTGQAKVFDWRIVGLGERKPLEEEQ